MHLNSFQVRLSFSLFAAFLFYTADLQAQVGIMVHGLKGETVSFSWYPEQPIGPEKKVELKLSAEGTGYIKPDVRSCQTMVVHGLQTEYSFLVQPGNDTIHLRYEPHQKLWQPTSANQGFYNKLDAIDTYVDQSLFRSGRRGSIGAAQKTRLRADSLRKAYTSENSCIENYAWFSAAFLEIASGVQTDSAFIDSIFRGRMSAMLNPAFAIVFHSVFDDLMLKKGKKNIEENWTNAFNAQQPALSFAKWVKGVSGVNNDTLLMMMMLNTIKELNSTNSISKANLLLILDDIVLDEPRKQWLNQIELLQRSIQYSMKGSPFPVFQFTDVKTGKLVSIEKLQGKPLYLVYLPSSNPDVIRNLLYLSALQKKYGKEMHFLAIVNHIGSNELAAMAQQQGFSFFMSTFDACVHLIPDVLESLAVPSYVLIDRKGNIWQSPAESPETNIEAAFLALIRQ
ncbi:MAG: redoxin family protein [Bacteroidia bacterium]|nr:redoxin family protein [Bacteroidia bacterium]